MSASSLPDLPVVDSLAPLRAALSAGNAVLTAPPGSGKTTVVPLALLDAPWLAGKRIVVLEPRRVAARAAAARMAQLLGEAVGETVGYQVRFERRIGPRTRIEVVTEGLLARRLQRDPELADVGLLIFDEFHERSLDVDLALALALDVLETLRPDLRLLVMSATLDAERVAALLGDVPVVTSQGRLFPVDIRYSPPPAGLELPQAVSAAAVAALREAQGDVLAFLPGAREIRSAQRELAARLDGIAICPLYGELPAAEQDAALRPDAAGRRKIILSTNLAQTSLTVEGVRTVVDAGFARVARFDLGAGADRLDTQRVSRAAAEQRAGRAGRLGPGIAYRLWSAEQQGMLAAQDGAELLHVDLTRFALELAAWGVREPSALRLLDRPPPSHWAYALDRLRELGAIDSQGTITAHGRALLRLPLPPRRAHMLRIAQASGLGDLAAWVAAVLDERDGNTTDLGELVERHRQGRAEAAAQRRVRESVRQMHALLRERAGEDNGSAQRADDEPNSEADIARIVSWAYPERIAQRRSGLRPGAYKGQHEAAFQCADGGEARVSELDPLARQDYLAIAHWTPGAQRRIRLACALSLEQLQADHAGAIQQRDTVAWDAASESVIAERQTRLGALVLERRPLRGGDGIDAVPAMLDGLRRLGLQALPWSDSCRQWQARVQAMRHWHPDEDWPAVDDDTLLATAGDWLAPYLAGMTRREHLARLDLLGILQARLDHARRQRLDRLAPTHLVVPTGSRLPLDYAANGAINQPGAAPALAVRLQEMFGCARTPRVDEGRVPVVLHLLSPAQRPIAVTADLAGFWAGSYADVRKDLRGRYPRHPWPDDPLSADPTRRAKPRPA